MPNEISAPHPNGQRLGRRGQAAEQVTRAKPAKPKAAA
jgi:hypothetical protein